MCLPRQAFDILSLGEAGPGRRVAGVKGLDAVRPWWCGCPVGRQIRIAHCATHSHSASFAAQANFLASSAVGTLAVGQVPSTIAANHVARMYSGANPALTASYVGFVNGDTPSVLIETRVGCE